MDCRSWSLPPAMVGCHAEPVQHVGARAPRRATPPMACVTGPRKRACMNTRRLAHRALAAATSLLVLGVATTANGQSPAHASSVSAASADRPSQGGLGAVTSASARVPAARFELHFRNLYPESA